MAAAVALLLVSCAKDDEIGRPPESGQVLALSESEGTAALDQKFAMQKGDVNYSEDGTVSGGRRSQYEGKKQLAFGGEWTGQSYGKKEYGKTSWNGSSDRATKSYDKGDGDSRFRSTSWLGGKASTQDGKRSNYDGRKKVTESVGTGAAYEESRSTIARPQDAKASWRRSVYPQPRIETLSDVQKKNVEETRSLLGRDD